MNLHLSPEGDDQNSGAPDAPLRSIEAALSRVRMARRGGLLTDSPTLTLRGGVYPLARPLRLDAADSGLCLRAAPGETPVLRGTKAIESWRETQLHGRAVWVAEVPALRGGAPWEFRALWDENGERLSRSRWPKEGFLIIEDIPGCPLDVWGAPPTWRFVYGEGDLPEPENWTRARDIEVIGYSLWLDHRLRVESLDPQTRMITLREASERPLVDDGAKQFARYRLDNVFEALSEPGEWFLDRETARLYYVPREGESPETLRLWAPLHTQLLLVAGEAGAPVRDVRFEGLVFEGSDWTPLSDDKRAGHHQGAWMARGALHFTFAQGCAVENCILRGVGGYGLELAEGCRGVRVVGNILHDLAAGGVHLNGGTFDDDPATRTGACQITDNEIFDYGRVWARGVGVLCRHAGGNAIAFNHIHHGFYSAISVGWSWSYAPSVASDNRIEGNHIHDIGLGLLSDMGGIYLLGVAAGTLVRGNLVHDITKYHYGGWAIYTDEGSSHVVIENNLCYDTNDAPFNQHYGRENIVRNNIWAFGGEAIVGLGNALGEHNQFTFERNIVLSEGAAFFRDGYAHDLHERKFRSNLNLFWSLGDEPKWTADWREQFGRELPPPLDGEQWRATGRDRSSRVADPLFADARARDFRLSDDSPALELGFEPFALEVGPRPREERKPVAALMSKPRQ